MADGDYERRGGREAELRRLQSILTECRARKAVRNDAGAIAVRPGEPTPGGEVKVVRAQDSA